MDKDLCENSEIVSLFILIFEPGATKQNKSEK